MAGSERGGEEVINFLDRFEGLLKRLVMRVKMIAPGIVNRRGKLGRVGTVRQRAFAPCFFSPGRLEIIERDGRRPLRVKERRSVKVLHDAEPTINGTARRGEREQGVQALSRIVVVFRVQQRIERGPVLLQQPLNQLQAVEKSGHARRGERLLEPEMCRDDRCAA